MKILVYEFSHVVVFNLLKWVIYFLFSYQCLCQICCMWLSVSPLNFLLWLLWFFFGIGSKKTFFLTASVYFTYHTGRAIVVKYLSSVTKCTLSIRYGINVEKDGNPLQYSCLENPVDRGAWWGAVHRVAQSWTRLKQLSMRGIHVQPDTQLII